MRKEKINYGIPLNPNQINYESVNTIPLEVIESFNKLIIINWDGNKAQIKQTDVINQILKEFVDTKSNLTMNDIFVNKWLYIEEIFESHGWDVEYIKYNEIIFIFKKSEKIVIPDIFTNYITEFSK